MIAPLPIFVTDPDDAQASPVRLLGDLKTVAEDTAPLSLAAGEATLDAFDRTDDVGEMRDLADTLEQLVGDHTAAAVDRGAAITAARTSPGDGVWLANTLIDLRQRYEHVSVEAQDVASRAAACSPSAPVRESAPSPLRVL